jgi:hypothetical protein
MNYIQSDPLIVYIIAGEHLLGLHDQSNSYRYGSYSQWLRNYRFFYLKFDVNALL